MPSEQEPDAELASTEWTNFWSNRSATANLVTSELDCFFQRIDDGVKAATTTAAQRRTWFSARETSKSARARAPAADAAATAEPGPPSSHSPTKKPRARVDPGDQRRRTQQLEAYLQGQYCKAFPDAGAVVRPFAPIKKGRGGKNTYLAADIAKHLADTDAPDDADLHDAGGSDGRLVGRLYWAVVFVGMSLHLGLRIAAFRDIGDPLEFHFVFTPTIILTVYTMYVTTEAIVNENPLMLLFVALSMSCLFAILCEFLLSDLAEILSEEGALDDWTRPAGEMWLSPIASVVTASALGLLTLLIIALSVAVYWRFGWRVYTQFTANTSHARPGDLRAHLDRLVAVGAMRFDVLMTIVAASLGAFLVAPPYRRPMGLQRAEGAWRPDGGTGRLWGEDERDYDENYDAFLSSLGLFLFLGAFDCLMRVVWFVLIRKERKWALRALFPLALAFPAQCIYVIPNFWSALECAGAVMAVCPTSFNPSQHELDWCLQCEATTGGTNWFEVADEGDEGEQEADRRHLNVFRHLAAASHQDPATLLKCLSPRCGRPNPAIGAYLRETYSDPSLPDPPVADTRWFFVLGFYDSFLILTILLCVVRLLTIAAAENSTRNFGQGNRSLSRRPMRGGGDKTSSTNTKSRSASSKALLAALPGQLADDPAASTFVARMHRGATVDIRVSGVQDGPGAASASSASGASSCSSSALAALSTSTNEDTSAAAVSGVRRGSSFGLYRRRSSIGASKALLTQGAMPSRFVQLSSDMATLRWSWSDYIALSEISLITIVQAPQHAATDEKHAKHARSWALRIRCGPSWSFQAVDLAFPTLTAAYRWARGLGALLGSTRKYIIAPALKHFLFEMFHRAAGGVNRGVSSLTAEALRILLSHLNFVADDKWKALMQRTMQQLASDEQVLNFDQFVQAFLGYLQDAELDPVTRLIAQFTESHHTPVEAGSNSGSHGLLDRSQFIALWRAAVEGWEGAGQEKPLPAPVLQMFDDIAEYRASHASSRNGQFDQRTSQAPAVAEAVPTRGAISVSDLRHMLLHDVNSVSSLEHDPRRTSSFDPLDLPYSLYFINTSHNTYCTGRQLQGRADVEMYTRVLKMGCRCVEIDAWDAKVGTPSAANRDPRKNSETRRPTLVGDGSASSVLALEPVVTHHYLTKPLLPLSEVLQAIRKASFPPRKLADGTDHPEDSECCGVSELPVIISLENNCSWLYQEGMARVIEEELGDVLMMPEAMRKGWLNPATGEYDTRFPPSPEQMRRKIILKSKVILAAGDAVSSPSPSSSSVPSAPTTTAPSAEPAAPTVEAPLSSNSRLRLEERLDESGVGSDSDGDGSEVDDELGGGRGVSTADVMLDETLTPASRVTVVSAAAAPALTVQASASSPSTKGDQKKKKAKATHPTLLALISQPGVPKTASPTDAPYRYGVKSLSEDKARSVAESQPTALIKRCHTQFIRAYPKATRALEVADRTSNLADPMAMWATGVQMVALNFQTHDLSMQLHCALFRLNGGCGYVLKPSYMCPDLGVEGEDDDDKERAQDASGDAPRPRVGVRVAAASSSSFASTASSSSSLLSRLSSASAASATLVPSPSPSCAAPCSSPQPLSVARIDLTILCGYLIKKPLDERLMPEAWMSPEERARAASGVRSGGTSSVPVEPYVVVRVFGGTLSGAAATVEGVRKGSSFCTATPVGANGLRPVWNETATLLTSHPELAIVHIELRARSASWTVNRGMGLLSADPLIAYAALPVRALRDGKLRALHLRDGDEKRAGARIPMSRLMMSVQTWAGRIAVQ